jgi:hypothetical protein
MPIADENLKRWRVPLILFLSAFVGALIFAAAHKHSADEPRNPATLATEAPPSHSKNRVVDSAGDASRENAALQKPGPPDPAAEKAAADSAARAADAAAELAASTAAPTN